VGRKNVQKGVKMTDEQKLRAREKRYLKKYGPFMTLELYDKILAAQDYKCGACGRPASEFSIAMNIDHFHFKIVAERTNEGFDLKWKASTEIQGRHLEQRSWTKKEAIAALRELAMPYSIRGLLCPGRYTGCNRLIGRIDKPDWLRKVIFYLENPPARKVLDLP
jgi:recombination endonuclease VII